MGHAELGMWAARVNHWSVTRFSPAQGFPELDAAVGL